MDKIKYGHALCRAAWCMTCIYDFKLRENTIICRRNTDSECIILGCGGTVSARNYVLGAG